MNSADNSADYSADNSAATSSTTTAERTKVRRARILCVDDDPNVSSAIARSLRSLGIDVMRAYNGIQGYWQLVTKRPDAVIIDLKMPEADGEELIDCLMGNRQTCFVPVIVLSGHETTSSNTVC